VIPEEWTDPRQVLAQATAVLRAPLAELPGALAGTLSELLPVRALAMLTGVCARSPLRTHGDSALTEKITSTELGRLAGLVDIGVPRFGPAVLAGAPRPVLAVAAAPAGAAGTLLAVLPAEDGVPPEGVPILVQELWNLLNVHLAEVAAQAAPAPFLEGRVAASERARVIGELTDAHGAVLGAVLGALRSRALDDTAARRTATDIAVSALIELRAAADLDRDLSEEPAGAAFARLSDRLSPLTRYSEVALELVPPVHTDWSLPTDVAHAARALTRGAVLAMLEQEGVTRIRVAWRLSDTGFKVIMRDDGPGELAPDALAVRRLAERATAIGGTLAVDATPGWGTTVSADLPVDPPSAPAPTPSLASLNPRELEILEQLTRGLRNRQIAERLSISENTVKFHVGNILNKLGVGSRGEAAALALASAPARARA
jgi:DNA-binding CsgD family transcriptional regulator